MDIIKTFDALRPLPARTQAAKARHDPVAGADQGRQLRDFVAAIGSADRNQLEKLLAPMVVAHADGGGIVRAAPNPIVGRDNVARYLVGLMRKFGSDVSMEIVEARARRHADAPCPGCTSTHLVAPGPSHPAPPRTRGT